MISQEQRETKEDRNRLQERRTQGFVEAGEYLGDDPLIASPTDDNLHTDPIQKGISDQYEEYEGHVV